ncbi:arsenate reductase family protein [Coprobacter tertius]|uniref:Arsenate reductase family protein n=1 Tax=Coprobacter tertius TaxID=2944915 RepID=A0ABT1MGV5_9BACT|nr:arsenate reductase family protein [Coprobacter tertius]MCP9611868.1 arsenate reductase family protein [Coprobacter tertius]
MEYLFLQYPTCDTCRKAGKWLDERNVLYKKRHITEQNPTYEELKKWIKSSGLPVKSFFNTSGQVYKELNLKDKLSSMSEEEQIRLLSSNGKLIKRPLIVGDNKVLVGFKPTDWECLK